MKMLIKYSNNIFNNKMKIDIIRSLKYNFFE